ncbi:MAG: aminomethyl-transferring glycine dehydrogenase subunit GcvPA [Candidatus Melainabacteria bacterium]|nr:aminomethyl-transferring glycine dehydrogenase subunit GcvPA [Candidatus Melainabacteria bacterium]
MVKNQSFPYLPHTNSDRDAMLKAIGVSTFEELIKGIPIEVRANGLEIASGMSELTLRQHVSSLAAKNKPVSSQSSFAGGGAYNRFVPACLPAIVGRSEFATAYTPYQPEVSQGSLQAIYEFQTAICLLTGMDVANASMYDGPTACAEAALMACRVTGRSKVLVAESVNPEYRLVTRTYSKFCGLSYREVRTPDAVVELQSLDLDTDLAGVIVQQPNYFGCFEDLSKLGQAVHKHGALLIVVADPISLGLLLPPGEFGADIVVGDAQPCGNFLSFGGPSAGYMACRQEFVRQLPGRLAGATVDSRGQRAFTLTLQTREQHIRRAKATSNICTNQALNALAMLVYLTLMGPIGLKEVAEISVRRAHYLAEKLSLLPAVKLTFARPFFNEFAFETKLAAPSLLASLREYNILGGIDLSRDYSEHKQAVLVCVTEMNEPYQLDEYVDSVRQILARAENPSAMLASGSEVRVK